MSDYLLSIDESYQDKPLVCGPGLMDWIIRCCLAGTCMSLPGDNNRFTADEGDPSLSSPVLSVS